MTQLFPMTDGGGFLMKLPPTNAPMAERIPVSDIRGTRGKIGSYSPDLGVVLWKRSLGSSATAQEHVVSSCCLSRPQEQEPEVFYRLTVYVEPGFLCWSEA